MRGLKSVLETMVRTLRTEFRMVPVAPLIVVPRYKLHQFVAQGKSCLGIKNTGSGVANELIGDMVLIVVAQDALHLPLRLLTDCLTNLFVRDSTVKTHCQVYERNIRRGNSKCYASDLSVQGWNYTTDRLHSGDSTRSVSLIIEV